MAWEGCNSLAMSRQLLTFRERSEESRQLRGVPKTDMSIIMNGVTLNGGDISVVSVREIKYVWLSLRVFSQYKYNTIFLVFFLC